MGLQFGRDICGTLATAEQREWLVTNGIGGYACGTVAGVLTRHHHSLLTAALPPPLGETLLLTRLDEQVIYGNQSYFLYCDRSADGVVKPRGYRYIERFVLEGTIPTWTYALGDALLKKRVWMEQEENTTYIQYSLKRGSQPIKLILAAWVDPHLDPEDATSPPPAMTVTPLETGVKMTAENGVPPVYVFANGRCTVQSPWRQERGLTAETSNDAPLPAVHRHGAILELALLVGQSVTIVASTNPPADVQLAGAIHRRLGHEQRILGHWYSARYLATKQAPLWLEQLVLAADQFIVRPTLTEAAPLTAVVAGYPELGNSGRNTLISLTGLAIATGRPEIARPVLRAFPQYLNQGLLPHQFSISNTGTLIPDYGNADVALWYFEAIRVYHAVTHDCLLLEDLFPVLAEIIRWYQEGTRYNIHVDTDGLLYVGEAGAALTWMDECPALGQSAVRTGKPIELSALWYNALLSMARFSDLLGVSGDRYRTLAETTRLGFQRFWHPELRYCNDVLDRPTGPEGSLHPNQLFAVAFPAADCWKSGLCANRLSGSRLLGEPLLSLRQQRAVVDVVARQLLTSYGLKTAGNGPALTADAPEQPPSCVWSWLLGIFVQAHLRAYGDPITARSFLEPMADHLQDGCVGSLSEWFGDKEPFPPQGSPAAARTVAEVLRAGALIENFSPPLP